MNYLDILDWNKVKADLEKAMKQGAVAVKRGALVVKKKAGELSDEGKRQYDIITLKAKVHRGISDLGARVYSLMGSRAKNPALDAKVKDIVAKIKKYESQIASLERSMKPSAAQKRKRKTKVSSR